MRGMLQHAYPFLVGAVLGGVFAVLRLPVPAPPTLSAAFAVVGITAGYLLVKAVFRL